MGELPHAAEVAPSSLSHLWAHQDPVTKCKGQDTPSAFPTLQREGDETNSCSAILQFSDSTSLFLWLTPDTQTSRHRVRDLGGRNISVQSDEVGWEGTTEPKAANSTHYRGRHGLKLTSGVGVSHSN